MPVFFEKWDHLGNSFLLVETCPGLVLEKTVVSSACKSNAVDGLLVYRETQSGPLSFEVVSFFNDDGSAAQYCGNGHICLATRALEQGSYHTHFGQFLMTATLQKNKDKIAYHLQPFLWKNAIWKTFVWQEAPKQELFAHESIVLTYGVPHMIWFVPENQREALIHFRVVSRTDLDRLQNHMSFETGINVTFVFFDSTSRPVGSLTYERGCRRFTSACSSGIFSSIIALLQKKAIAPESMFSWYTAESSLDLRVEDEALWVFSTARQIGVGVFDTNSNDVYDEGHDKNN